MQPVIDRAYEQKLLHSCRVLFGPGVDIGWEFLLYLQPSGIKTAFRRRALLTHPDRASRHGTGAALAGTALFIESKDACDNLLDFVRKRHTLSPPRDRGPHRPSTPGPGAAAAGRKTCHSRHRDTRSYRYRGDLPRRRLLLGEFLFYSGIISWDSLIKAIVWQRSQRPRLGEIAARRGWVKESDTRWLARHKRLGLPMGEALVRGGLLSRAQVQTLLRRQRQMQRALGEFFVSRGLVSRQEIERLAGGLAEHNRKFAPRGNA